MASDSPPTQPRPPRFPAYRPALAAPAGLTLLAVVLALFLIGGGFILLTQKTVTVDVDGQVSTIRTHQATVGDILDDLNVALSPGDALSPPPGEALQDGTVIRVRRARRVLVEADGEVIELHTLQHEPLALLEEAGVSLGRYDLIRVDGQPIPDPTQYDSDQPPVVVQVIRAVSLTVDDDGQVRTLYTTEPTVGEALQAIGMALYLADAITPDVDTPVTDGMRITVRRSVPLTIIVDGTEIQSRARANTVAEALTVTGLALIGEDYSIPPPEAPLPSDGIIRVVRVTEEVTVEYSAIPYETIYRPDDSMALDEQRLIQAGAPGVSERRTRIRYEDGVEVSRVEEPPRMQQPPVDEIIAYGTRIVIRTLETPDGPLEYWRVIRMLATSYSPATSSKPPDAPNYGIASTGIPVERGIVAVDPEVIPYFTRVYVPGYGEGLAADTGGAINGRRIDLGYSDDDLVLWYSWVDVYLLTPPPPPEDILYVLP